MSVVAGIVSNNKKGAPMPTKLPLSPIPSTDQWCEYCEEKTLHISYLTALDTNPLAKFYALECEPCMLSAEWI